MSGSDMLFYGYEVSIKQLQWLGDYPRCLLSETNNDGK